MNGKDFISVLEYMNAFHKQPKLRRKKANLNTDLDVVELLRRKQKELKMIEDFLKEQEKLNKKEDKKPEDKPLISAPKLAMILVASFPLTAPLYVMWFSNMLRSVGWK